MARLQYFVVLHQGQWKVKYDGEHYGPYDTQKAAIRAAVDAAHKSGKNGHDAQVLIQRDERLHEDGWSRQRPRVQQYDERLFPPGRDHLEDGSLRSRTTASMQVATVFSAE